MLIAKTYAPRIGQLSITSIGLSHKGCVIEVLVMNFQLFGTCYEKSGLRAPLKLTKRAPEIGGIDAHVAWFLFELWRGET